jgi:carotenoid cleavage dioxygenase-like enzyme
MTCRDRRRFLQLLGLSGAAAMLPPAFLGCDDDAEAMESLADTGPALPPGLSRNLMRWNRDELDVGLKLISGKLPADLSGHAFIIGALPYPDGTFIFNGDGMVLRVDLDPGAPRVKTAIMRTPCWHADQALLKEPGHPWSFVNLGIVRLSSTLGIRNQLNTAFQPMGDRLLVTYDGGRPYELDVHTLELITPVGSMEEWRDSIPFVQGPFRAHMSTAHPCWDEHTGELWTVNFGAQFGDVEAFTDVIRWDGQGALRRWTLVDAQDKPVAITQSVHQMTLTQDYLVIVDCAFLVENEQFFDPNIARPQEPDAAVYIVERAALKADATRVTARRLVIPREIVHLTADYENPDGKITLHVVHACATDASEWLRAGDTHPDGSPVDPALVGYLAAGTDSSPIGRHVIDGKSGKLVSSRHFSRRDYWSPIFFTHQGNMAPGRFEHLFFNASGFQDELLTTRMLDLYRDYPHRTVPIAEVGGTRPGVLFHFDPQRSGVLDSYTMPPGRALGSPQFIPRAGARDSADGYILCTVVSDDTRPGLTSGHEFWLFDARDLSKGPLARLSHPELRFGFTLHTTYLPTLKPRASTYRIAPAADYAKLLEGASEEVQAFMNSII